MINFFAKFLVIVYTVLSIAAMTWAAAVFLQFKDYGWTEPYKEVLDYTKEGNEKTSVRHASIYDKSLAALNEAAKTRDLAYARVKPAVDKLKATEPFLADNHLYYTKVLKELREATGPIEVKRLEDAGTALEGGNPLGKPLTKIAVNGVTKSFSAYHADLKKLMGSLDPVTKTATSGELDKVEEEIRKIIAETKAFTGKLTGTDETNKYVQPGLYQLIDLEYKAQVEIKKEIEAVTKPKEKATEDARLYRIRRVDLEEALDALKALKKP